MKIEKRALGKKPPPMFDKIQSSAWKFRGCLKGVVHGTETPDSEPGFRRLRGESLTFRTRLCQRRRARAGPKFLRVEAPTDYLKLNDSFLGRICSVELHLFYFQNVYVNLTKFAFKARKNPFLFSFGCRLRIHLYPHCTRRSQKEKKILAML